ncbi:hypothetical protein CLV88_1146 [Shimia abyssi]|uniref:Uncharacterized protein n=1 Tax=Shimia abyssi TaxID=1662395 RepID=A0A2P8F7T8_9RHOB|nr:hypothetical protein CLV88_1146 [Shimia abyssi]
MLHFDPVQHGAQRDNFCLSDRSCAFHIHDDAVISVDQIVG